MPGSKLDQVYRSILITKFFTKGWGKPENLKRLFAFRKILSNRETCFNLVPKDYPITIIKEEILSDYVILEGKFLSPFVTHLPGLLPQEAEFAHFQAVLPKHWNEENFRPVCIHLAGTGDHGFWRRRQIMAKPLLKEFGIGAVIVENPFYGARKPKDQVRSSLHNVSDIFVMGGCLILESLALFHWCENNGWGPLGITGLSMGGHMASLAATNWPKPIVLVPCLSGSTAAPVFTKGVMSDSINWKLLESQYHSESVFREEIRKMIKLDEDAFWAGKHFAKHFPESMEHVKKLKKEQMEKKLSQTASVVSQPNHAISSEYKLAACSMTDSSMKSTDVSVTELSHNNVVEYHTSNIHKTTINPAQTEETYKNDSNIKYASIKNEQIRSNSINKSSISANNGVGKNDWTKSFSLNQLRPTEYINSLSLLSNFSRSTLKFLNLHSENQPPHGTVKNKVVEVELAKLRDHEALQFMRGIMNECTHLQNFSVPVDPSLIIAIKATADAYVPQEDDLDLAEIWPGSEVRYINAGHVSAYLLYQNAFRLAIKDGFERMKKKYYS